MVADTVKKYMYRDDVEPYWLQVPFKLTNSTSHESNYLHCWNLDKKDEWIREKDPVSIKENKFGTERFHELFPGFKKWASEEKFDGDPVVSLAGVRTSESPNRYVGLTSSLTYKDITWGRGEGGGNYTFYPIYDWKTPDIWKHIHDNDLDYCELYDYQFKYGLRRDRMRVSALHHETSVRNLFYIKEIEPDTYEKLEQRLPGIDSAEKFGEKDFYVDEVPDMFKGWEDYRDYLLDHLIKDKDHYKKFKKKFKELEEKWGDEHDYDEVLQAEVKALVLDDIDMTSIQNFTRGYKWRKYNEKNN